MGLDVSEIEAMFTASDGYRFARWGRPICPVVFGAADASVATFKGAIEAVTALAGVEIGETDPELGANLMFFFMASWSELLDVPDMDKLIPGLEDLVQNLVRSKASHYRLFRFDEAGAIKACFVLNCVDEAMAETPADELALAQAAQVIVLWGDKAFSARSPLVRASENGMTILRPDVADIIRAAYAPAMPLVASDPSHALRLSARIKLTGGDTK